MQAEGTCEAKGPAWGPAGADSSGMPGPPTSSGAQPGRHRAPHLHHTLTVFTRSNKSHSPFQRSRQNLLLLLPVSNPQAPPQSADTVNEHDTLGILSESSL